MRIKLTTEHKRLETRKCLAFIKIFLLITVSKTSWNPLTSIPSTTLQSYKTLSLLLCLM